jgi:hypothetical protein
VLKIMEMSNDRLCVPKRLFIHHVLLLPFVFLIINPLEMYELVPAGGKPANCFQMLGRRLALAKLKNHKQIFGTDSGIEDKLPY